MRSHLILPLILLCTTAEFGVRPHAAESNTAEQASVGNAIENEQPASPFVVHEWGTFTTFSGSDGVFLEFRPLADEANDLPAFVANRASNLALSVFSKARIRGKVRMETPVTYFYTDRVRTVDVRVDFPKGLLTEFYPPPRKMLPAFDQKAAYGKGEPIGNSSLDWGQLTLIPVDKMAPPIAEEDRHRVAQRIVNALLPRGNHDGHYVQARATDSAIVHLHQKAQPSLQTKSELWPQWIAGQSDRDYFEKFLFYRGVGKFELPLRSVVNDDDRVSLENNGAFIMPGAVLIEIRDGNMKAATLEAVSANQSSEFPGVRDVTETELSRLVQQLLVAQGLYEKEASAMVETWKASWFHEEGTRVLYIVPETLTDELLPLTVKPVPDETLRVLVGRMELMSPANERELVEAVRKHYQHRIQIASDSPEEKQSVLAIPEEIQRYGRMMEPALVRISKVSGDHVVRTEAERLIAQIRTPTP